MKEAMRGTSSVTAGPPEETRRPKRRVITRCSICNSRIRGRPLRIMEPEGVPEPRLIWTFCKPCYRALLHEMRVSPVRSPLRLRIAVGMVASDRWPQAYPSRVRLYLHDRRWFLFIMIGLIVAMIVHLALIVAIAGLR